MVLHDLNAGPSAHEIVDRRHIARAHPDATEAGRGPQEGLLWRPVDVDAADEGVAVMGLKAVEPEDACHDRVAAGSIGLEYLARGFPRLEDRTERGPSPDFFSDAEMTERGRVASLTVSCSEFRGRDLVKGDGLPIRQDQHLLIRHA